MGFQKSVSGAEDVSIIFSAARISETTRQHNDRVVSTSKRVVSFLGAQPSATRHNDRPDAEEGDPLAVDRAEIRRFAPHNNVRNRKRSARGVFFFAVVPAGATRVRGNTSETLRRRSSGAFRTDRCGLPVVMDFTFSQRLMRVCTSAKSLPRHAYTSWRNTMLRTRRTRANVVASPHKRRPSRDGPWDGLTTSNPSTRRVCHISKENSRQILFTYCYACTLLNTPVLRLEFVKKRIRRCNGKDYDVSNVLSCGF